VVRFWTRFSRVAACRLQAGGSFRSSKRSARTTGQKEFPLKADASTVTAEKKKQRHTTALALVLAAASWSGHIAPRAAAPSNVAQTARTDLRRDIDGILSRPALERAYWGILVRSLAANDSLYALNAGKLMMPASNMKIVTLLTAADRLGWAYTYETRLVAAGPITAGKLEGDLVVVGSGDPTISHEGLGSDVLDLWAERVKAAGIRAIDGRIVGDDNAFDDETLGPGWAWDYLASGYATGVGALQLNENVVWVTATPAQTVGSPALVSISPDDSGLDVRSDLKTTAVGTTAAVTTRRLPGSSRLALRGSVPVGTTPILIKVSVDNPTQYFVNALRATLIAHGIDVQGPAVDIDDLASSQPQQERTVLASYRSPPLSTLAIRMMKWSQNLYAETLLKTMGAVAGAAGVPGGREAVRSTLDSWGVSPTGLVMIDGSGLSRYNLVTPETLVTILTRARRDERLRGTFEEALPIAGRDGTLEGRMKNTPAENNVRAKTGSIANARGISGYVKTADGEPLVFSILANNFEILADEIDRATDAILIRLARFKR
jgi:serine-type D-Ala-D-Ala carboxypeptidase/endopeptidase (penicillin-binding protein 4)